MRDVEAAHDLEPAHHGPQDVEGGIGRVVQDAVDSHPDADALRCRLDVEVGRAVGHRLFEQGVDQLDDRSVVDEGALTDLGLDVVVVGGIVERTLDQVRPRVRALDRGQEVSGAARID